MNHGKLQNIKVEGVTKLCLRMQKNYQLQVQELWVTL